MKLLRNISFPLVPVYYIAAWVRNKLYDFRIKKSMTYDFPVICVGNLSLGGTGKTPMIEYLIRLLKDDFRVATLSRGYKRVTKGFRLADKNSTAKIIGDEPYQFYNRFKDEIVVAVDENRKQGIDKLCHIDNCPEVILLDDAFQHRRVRAGLNILLTTYDSLYVNDIVLPFGNLREPKSGANRAQIIVVTKCPDDLNGFEKNRITDLIKPQAHQKIFFSSIKYSNKAVAPYGEVNLQSIKDFTLVTGIADPKPLVEYLKSKGLSFEHLNFKDHYEFTDKDISVLKSKPNIVTTEKDFMRLKPFKTLQKKLLYLPIEVKIDKEIVFNELIQDFVKS